MPDPMPTIQWDKDLQYIFNNDSDTSRFHILENGTLHIVEIHLDDEGAYGCTIGSSAGLKREEIKLIVKGICLCIISIVSISEQSFCNFLSCR